MGKNSSVRQIKITPCKVCFLNKNKKTQKVCFVQDSYLLYVPVLLSCFCLTVANEVSFSRMKVGDDPFGGGVGCS